MAIPISLASRSLRCPRTFHVIQAPFTRGLALSSCTQATRSLANARLLSTISSPRSLKDYRGLRSASSSPTIGKPLSKWADLQCLRIRSWQPVRMISSSRGLQQDKDERKITEKVSAATSKILSSLPIPQHENIYTIPNILTFSRLVAAPVVGWAILAGHPTLAISLFAYAAVTDLVDGFIARHFKQESVVGTIIDPMADKFLMTVGVVCLSLQNAIPLWLATIIIGRDVGLAFSALYFRWISLPPPKTMARYWDFSLPSAEVKPTLVSKVNTALQLLLVWSAMAFPVLPEAFLASWHAYEGMTGLQYLVAGTTVWSGLSYVFSKDAVKILSDEDIHQRLARQRRAKEIEDEQKKL
ncbi:cardiolipin synthetase [Ascosphaera apis ARSEF 7405]|uniref:Cardiolipin synthetase n=1 Tax=Ascosphaera apis ARSEF 7405 TaxID=392613 RepID=A0A167YG03_9EURO|nr:cardiolipin synthetase [Ascosphaera apis ARSEF 7405]